LIFLFLCEVSINYLFTFHTFILKNKTTSPKNQQKFNWKKLRSKISEKFDFKNQRKIFTKNRKNQRKFDFKNQ
jgi:hypothetical protein